MYTGIRASDVTVPYGCNSDTTLSDMTAVIRRHSLAQGENLEIRDDKLSLLAMALKLEWLVKKLSCQMLPARFQIACHSLALLHVVVL